LWITFDDPKLNQKTKLTQKLLFQCSRRSEKLCRWHRL